MDLKKVTIVILPDGVRTVKQVRIPRFLLVFFIFSVLFVVAFLAWASLDYYKMKTQEPQRAELIRENRQQGVQLAAFASEIDKINRKMVKLNKFDNRLRVMVNLEPGDDNAQFIGVGGSDPTLTDPGFSVENAHQTLIRSMHQSLDNLDTEIPVQTKEKIELYNFLKSQKSMFACTPSIWPVNGWLTSKFGYRISPFTNEKEFHEGIDIAARIGSPVIAPADGVVAFAGKSNGYGNLLVINHGYGLQTRYGHLSKFLVKKGEEVKRGEKIALVGDTGRSTGPHLHYEVHVEGVPVNPLRYILN